MKTRDFFSKKNGNHPFITGTLILTLTGLCSRFIGFFYRIYLSRLFGEEGMGVYQLLGPVTALAFSLTAAGMQTAISKYVASEVSTHDRRSSVRYLLTGLFLSLSLSLVCMEFVLHCSEWIAVSFLKEARTASMLRIISLSIPLSAVHSCINGYYYGIKKTGLPSFLQLLEQFCRILCVFIAERCAAAEHTVPHINAAVIGLVVGEFLAMVIALLAAWLRFSRFGASKKQSPAPAFVIPSYQKAAGRLLALAIPLSFTRIVINLLQSAESVAILSKLQAYGYSSAGALSVYGVLSGMALPVIYFPNALTGSISLMLLPVISEADAAGNHEAVKRTFDKTIYACLFLGGVFTLFFLLCGRPIGTLLFHSAPAGNYICLLSFICPFLYLCTTLSSILHGLGKAMSLFFINVFSLLIRLAAVFFLVPQYGIFSYLAAMLVSELFTALCYFLLLRRILRKKTCAAR